MTTKADFNAEEWDVVVQGPPMAGMIVIAAERGGTLRESVSMAQAYAEARQRHGASELLDEIVRANPQVDQTQVRSVDDVRDHGLQRLRDAVGILQRKATPEEVDAYRNFVADLAERVANAHKEGGVLGVGGKPVSDNEQRALDEIIGALDAGPAS